MSFVSLGFALFLAAALLVFHCSPARFRPSVLLVVSLAFYASWSPWHVPLLLLVTAAVYLVARQIEGRREQPRLRLTAVAVTALLVLLTFFKCSQWLVDAIQAKASDGAIDLSVLLVAPLGLSYYLFKLLGYLLDVYWEKLPAQRSYLALALHASFFPQIVSGPIQRADDFFEQLPVLKTPVPDQFLAGLRRILFGLFKKVVIADQLAVVVTHVHVDPLRLSSLELLLGAYAFSLEMYADFSGITDIAIGVGLLFGIRGPENFDRPFFAQDLQDYWRRWHMSLTSWLTDYLFTPLRMAFRNLGNVGLSLAIFFNMVAVGVWHGPRWTYLVFGAINGVLMIGSALTLKRRNKFLKKRPTLTAIHRIVGPFTTFHLIVFVQIFFQASDLTSCLAYLGRLFGLTHTPNIAASRVDFGVFGISGLRLMQALLALVAMEAVHFAAKDATWVGRFTAAPRVVRWGLYYALAVGVVLSVKGKTGFIYAQF